MYRLTYASRLRAGTKGLNTIAVVAAATLILAGCGAPKSAGNGTTGGGNGNPPNQGPPQEVHLIWKQATNEWKVKLNNGGEENPKTAKITLPQGTGPTMVIVDIAGYPGATFKDSGALDVWENAKGSSPGINSTQILGPIVTKQGKLVFYDLNLGNAVTLYYSLNFNNGVPPADPIMDNGGSS
jgi:hypothetical protein